MSWILKKNFFRGIKILLGILFSLVGSYFAFRDINFQKIWTILRSANLVYLLLAFVLIISSVWLLALRWKIILSNSKRINTYVLLEGQFLGYFGNNILPLRMGEILRSYFISKKVKMSFSEILGSVVLERFIDILVVFLFILFLILSGLALHNSFSNLIFIFVGFGIFLAIFLFIAMRQQNKSFLSRKFNEVIDSFLKGMSILKYVDKLPILGLLTLFIWFLYGIIVSLVFSAIHIHSDIKLIILILTFAAIGLNLPSAPGSFGTHHIAVIIALREVIGLEEAISQGASILYHASNYIPLTLIGFYVFIKNNISIIDIRKNSLNNFSVLARSNFR